jgi:tRNA(Ile)-lysidine synthase
LSLLIQLKQFIHKHQLFKKDVRLLLAVSGGLDSMVMLHLLHETGYNISVAHCNFGLRGDESEGDAAFIEETCRALNITFYLHKFDTEQYASANAVSIQMAARTLRYEWFHKLCAIHGYDSICTAHHANDNTETVLLNLTKGTGLAGLKGIPLRNDNIVRPLLNFTRAQLEVYAKQKNIHWRDDSSNASVDYQRNQIRLQVVPVLKQINGSLEETLSAFSRIMTENAVLVEERIQDLLGGLMETNDQQTILHTQTIKEHAALNSILYFFLNKYGFNPEVVHTIADAIRGNNSGKQFFSKDFRVINDRERIIITSLHTMQEPPDVMIEAGLTVISLPDGLLRMQIMEVEPDWMFENKDPQKAFLDASALNFPLRCRRWIKGDYFYPLGLEHRQKLSDYFIDHKVPLSTKEINWILINGEDIVWVIGQRIDHRYRLTEKTEQVLSLEWRAHGTANAF